MNIKNFIKSNLGIICIILIIYIIISPLIFSYKAGNFVFDGTTANIGDTLGGITAPIIGILSIILLYVTLKEQMEFNKIQRKNRDDEQFKSTYFFLLEKQHGITTNLSYQIKTLESNLIKECNIYSYNGGTELQGIEFFTKSISELYSIYNALYSDEYNQKLSLDEVSIMTDSLQRELYTGQNLPKELEIENEKKFTKTRTIIINGYTNAKFHISETEFVNFCSKNDEDKCKFIFEKYIHHYINTSIYYLHLICLLEYIDTRINEELSKNEGYEQDVRRKYSSYINMLKTQLCPVELFHIFYASFYYKNLQKYIIKFDILSNLKQSQILCPQHNCLPNYKLL